jgi:hypothetical protein
LGHIEPIPGYKSTIDEQNIISAATIYTIWMSHIPVLAPQARQILRPPNIFIISSFNISRISTFAFPLSQQLYPYRTI